MNLIRSNITEFLDNSEELRNATGPYSQDFM